MVQLTCQGCGEGFEASRKTAKWCSDRCRKASKRREPSTDAAEPGPSVDAPRVPDPDAVSLVESVRRDLEQAGRLATFSGQLALQLAKRLANPDESGISSLSKELRTVMAAALEGATPAPAADDQQSAAEAGEPDDEVTRARRQREEARQAAGLA